MIDINVTALIQCLNFLVSIVLLNVLLIKPIRSIVSKRRQTVAGLEASVAGFVDEANERLSSYEKALECARYDAASLRASARLEAVAAGQTVIHDAEQAANATLAAAQADMEADMRHAQEALTSDMHSFASLAVKKLLA